MRSQAVSSARALTVSLFIVSAIVCGLASLVMLTVCLSVCVRRWVGGHAHMFQCVCVCVRLQIISTQISHILKTRMLTWSTVYCVSPTEKTPNDGFFFSSSFFYYELVGDAYSSYKQ